MIILEGPDGAGKSSLGRVLSHEFKLKLFHPGGAPDLDKFEEYSKICRTKLLDNQICDRVSQISEYVYGPITNGRNIQTREKVSDFLSWCNENSVLVIYCKPKNIGQNAAALQVKSHKPEAFLKLVRDNHEKIVANYEELFSLPSAKLLRKANLLLDYDYTSIKSEHKILRLVHEKCKMRGLVE